MRLVDQPVEPPVVSAHLGPGPRRRLRPDGDHGCGIGHRSRQPSSYGAPGGERQAARSSTPPSLGVECRPRRRRRRPRRPPRRTAAPGRSAVADSSAGAAAGDAAAGLDLVDRRRGRRRGRGSPRLATGAVGGRRDDDALGHPVCRRRARAVDAHGRVGPGVAEPAGQRSEAGRGRDPSRTPHGLGFEPSTRQPAGRAPGRRRGTRPGRRRGAICAVGTGEHDGGRADTQGRRSCSRAGVQGRHGSLPRSST